MRLLYVDETGTFRFTKEYLDTIPPYAILSHTWGEDEDEVTFLDVFEGSIAAQAKKGWKKLTFCLQQARKDDLHHFWVDTCCIDKRNFTEYSEAINSMFKWYQQAKVCYVYMTDVLCSAVDAWERPFRDSRWFTRGWTLQELLAPTTVEFYNYAGEALGTRRQHAKLIHEITGIEIEALYGTPIMTFSVENRFRWAVNRRTKKEEDAVYCLLGIFGVSMPLIYAEGKDRALSRLEQEIATAQAPRQSSLLDTSDTQQQIKRRLAILKQLSFSTMDIRRSTISQALQNTCNWILCHENFVKWRNHPVAPVCHSIIWIKGHPGAGKSTIMKYIEYQLAEDLRGKKDVLASFYFTARGDVLEHSVDGMYRSLIVQILKAVPLLDRTLDQLCLGHKEPPDPEFFNNVPLAVLKEIFSAILSNISGLQLYLIIDALDETKEEEVLDMVYYLRELGDTISGRENRMFICFASRHYPTLDIPTNLQIVIDREAGHHEDLRRYVEAHLHIKNEKQAEQIRRDLLEKANGIFIWIVLVIEILNKVYRRGTIFLVQRRLKQIPGAMTELLENIAHHGDVEDMPTFLLCLQWVLFAKRPLTLEEFYFAMVAGQPDIEDDDLRWDIDHLSREAMENFMLSYSKGLVELTGSEPRTVQFIHESIKDFLLREDGLKSICHAVDGSTIGSAHEALRRCCERGLICENLDKCDLQIIESWRLREEQKRSRELATICWPFLRYAAEHVLHHAEEASQAFPQVDFCRGFNVRTWSDICIAIDIRCWRGDRATAIDERGDRPTELTQSRHFWFVLLARNYQQLAQAFMTGDAAALTLHGASGMCALQFAISDGQADIIPLLLQAGAALDWRTFNGLTALHFAAASSPGILQLVLQYKPDVNAVTHTGQAPIHSAAMLSSIENLQLLLLQPVDRNLADNDGWTALHFAVEFGVPDAVELLINAGVDINRATKTGQVALHSAACDQNLQNLRLLLEAGAITDVKDTNERTPLVCAIEAKNIEACELLIHHNAPWSRPREPISPVGQPDSQPVPIIIVGDDADDHSLSEQQEMELALNIPNLKRKNDLQSSRAEVAECVRIWQSVVEHGINVPIKKRRLDV